MMELGPVRERLENALGNPPTEPTRPALHATPAPATSPRSALTMPLRPAPWPVLPQRSWAWPCSGSSTGASTSPTVSGRWPTPAIPGRPQPVRPGCGRPPPTVHPRDGGRRFRAAPVTPQPTASRPPQEQRHETPPLPRERPTYARRAKTPSSGSVRQQQSPPPGRATSTATPSATAPIAAAHCLPATARTLQRLDRLLRRLLRGRTRGPVFVTHRRAGAGQGRQPTR
jgi:hypothetical protein